MLVLFQLDYVFDDKELLPGIDYLGNLWRQCWCKETTTLLRPLREFPDRAIKPTGIYLLLLFRKHSTGLGGRCMESIHPTSHFFLVWIKGRSCEHILEFVEFDNIDYRTCDYRYSQLFIFYIDITLFT